LLVRGRFAGGKKREKGVGGENLEIRGRQVREESAKKAGVLRVVQPLCYRRVERDFRKKGR